MSRLKRFLAMAMVVIMVIGLLPVSALAADGIEAGGYDAGGFTGSWSLRSEDTQTDTWAITGPSTVEVGSSITLTGTEGKYSNSWSSSSSGIATVDGDGGSAMVTGVSAGEVTITHTYKNSWRGQTYTETFTVTVTAKSTVPATSLDIVEDTLTIYAGTNYGTNLHYTVDPDEATITWTSSNTSVATVDSTGKVTGVKAGTATITASSGGLTDTCEVTVNATSGKTMVYVYLNAANLSDYNFPNLTANDSGWYTIGYVALDSAPTASSGAINDTIRGYLANVVRFTDNTSIPMSFLLSVVETYNLKSVPWGADDYVGSGDAWHLDLYAPEASTTYPVVINYINEATGDVLETTTAQYAYGATVEAGWYKKTISGYTYDYANPDSIKVSNNAAQDVLNLYYKKNGAVTVTLDDKTVTYNGEVQSLTNDDVTISGGPAGLTLTDLGAAISDGKGTDVGTYAGTITGDAQYVSNGTTYDVIYQDGSLTINPATLTITTPDANKVYDGTPLTAEGSITGFVNGETATFKTTGSQTAVGSSDNTYSLVFDETAKEGNYTISESIGTLTVTEYAETITVTTTGGTFIYDGEAHGATVSVSELPKGYTLETATSNATATNVAEGTVTATCDTLVIRNKAGEDVTEKLSITYVDGSITINPATLTVTTPSESKVYDGTALTAEGSIDGFVNGETATFKTTGSQTAVGSSTNTYSLTWDGEAVESNYTVSESLGTLTVTEYAGEITVTTTGGTFTYDGKAHGATVSVSELPTGYELVTATSSATATNVTTTAVTATCNNLVIRNAEGKDVTSKLNIRKVDGSITINPAPLTVATESASKVYDGTALTAGGTITGFVNGETATLTTTGSQTAVGTSENTYSITWGTAKKSNYTVNENLGTLTVTEYADEIVVTTTGGTFPYDGEAHGAKVTVSPLPTGYTIETASSNATATHVADGTVTATCDNLVIKNAQGKDVTNSLKIKYVDGSITITPATLTVTTPNASKTYDGEALTAAGSITGFVNGETATFETTGSQTAVGTSDNTYTINWNGTAAESDYTVNETVGELEVTEYAGEIVVTTTGDTYTYDGKAHGATVSVSELPTGYTLETATSSATATHVAESPVTATCDTLVILNAQGVDVTNNLKITKVTGTITITPTELTITTPDASKVYDGTALTAKGSITGFVNGDTATFTTTGSQTAVGTSDNTYSLTWDGAVASDYTISATVGKLTVTEYAGEITVTTTGGTFTYDGEAHGATVSVSKLPAGYSLDTATSSATATDVTTTAVEAKCDNLVIRNAAGQDVTSKLNITYVDGSITINPATLTVTTPDASKVYDGKALTAAGTIDGFVNGETATFATTGSQTAVGNSKNTYSLTWDGTAKESNYTISESVGTLTVTENAEEITVTTTGGTFTYDGKAHGATVEVSELPAGYTLETATSNATATDVTTTPVPATCDTLVIKNAQGVDVTSKLNIRKVDGSITITPATLTVTTPSESKVYDGTPLTAAGSISGFVNGETATLTTTGTQTAVGNSKNTYNITWDGTAKESNYTIIESIGTLTVTESEAEIVVTTTGGTFTYDGKAHGATVTVSELPAGYTLETASSNATATDVTTTAVTATCDTLVIRNADGVDVTDNLNITYVDGSITITPATLTVTTPNATKVYDGTALTAEGSITGFVNGETAAFTTTGSQTAVGSSDNTYKIDWNGTAKASNYTVSATVGKLTVTENAEEITVTTTGGEFTYDGAAHGATVSVSELPTGYTLETATSNATATDVGTVTATCNTLVIRNAQGKDVTSKLNINYENGSITINPATLTVTTPDASKVYDGTALTAEGSISGFVNGETATFTTTGSQTAVGSSDNTYSITWNGTAKESNYTVSATVGKLTVTEYAGEITVTTTGGEFTYDGKAHGATVAVSGLPKGYTVRTATSDDTATHVDEGTVTATCDTLVIWNAQNEDVTEKLIITYVDGSITIKPATLTVTTPDATKVYDGTALTSEGSISGFVNGETATFATTGTQTAVGSSDNTYSITWDGTATESDYTVSATVGKLTVTENAEEITVTTTGGTFTYDGKAHGATVSVSELPTGYTLETATSSATATDVTTTAVTATCDTLVIKNAEGKDVTSKLNIRKVDGSITINPATLTVTTPSESKVYDGTALTAEGSITGFVNGETATLTTTGSQTAVGTSENTYSITWGTAKESNYTISATVGTLTVTESEDEIVVTTTGGTFTYDGKAHGATVSVSELPTGYTLETATSSATAINVTPTAVTATCDTLVIRNAEDEDVTSKLNIRKVDGSITITPATLTVTTPNATKVYDGEALTAAGTITGFVNGETAPFKTTGTQTAVGSSKNTYKIDWNGASATESNYTISESIGTLTVTENTDEIVVTTTGGEFPYDGMPHGATVSVSTLPKGYKLETATSSATATNVGTVTATCDTLVIKNAQGVDVTSELNIKKIDDSITITPKEVTVTANAQSKTYGDADPELTAAVSGTIGGDEISYTISRAEGEDVGEYAITVSGEELQGNYKISYENNTLTITLRTLTITTKSDSKVYDGTPLTAGIESMVGVVGSDVNNVTATGSQTLVGSSENGYIIDWAPDKKDNYTVVSVLGILTVTDGSSTESVEPDNVIVKSHDDEKEYGLGDTVTFTITVTNIYDAVKTITITEQEGVTLKQSVFPDVEPGETVETTATYTITEADILAGEFKNTATATFSGEEEKPYNGEDTVEELDDPNGNVSVTKTVTNTPADGSKYALGETITYAITVKNDGNVTLTDLTVEDELTGDTWTIDSLAPGEEKTYTASHEVTEADILAGEVVNVATASGNSKDPHAPNPEEAGKITTDVDDPNGHMTVTKTTTSKPANGSAYVLGETITYAITVKNDGNLTLTDILVTDELTGDTWEIASLAPGVESDKFTAEYTVTEADVLTGEVTNVATAAGESKDDEKPGVTDGETTDPIQKQGASISVVKEVTGAPAEGGTYALGETIEYKITVTNNGDITVENITVEDELTGDTWTIDSLAPGAVETYTASYEVTEADILAGEVVNVATASGKSEDPDAPNPEDQGEITTDVDDPNGSVSVTKTVTSTPADGSKYALGETIAYEIVVKNNGNLTLTDLTVEDELTGDTWAIDSLAPGAVETYTASYTVTAADIANGGVTNVAVAEGASPDGTNPEAEDEITSDTEDPNAHLTIVKTITSETPARGYYDIGETITYRIVVTNDGNVDLTNVVTTDELTGESWTAASLKVGESAVYTTSYVVQESDAGTTGVVNTATVSGDGPTTDPDDPKSEDSTDPAPVVQYYTLTVNYVYEDGTPAADTVVRTLLPGAVYNIPSPAISNYTPNAAFVSGTMAASNLTVTITYAANPPAPTPTQPEPPVPPVPPVVIDTPEQQVVITPDPEQGVLIEEDDNGDIVVTQISEDEVPLADLDLDDHKDCVLHTLFLLAALIVLAVYTSRAKKLQKEIQELTERVEIEKKKREGQNTDEDHE